MAKTKTIFYCTECGNESPKWQGRCTACGAWNTMKEHVEKPAPVGRATAAPVGVSRTAQKLTEVCSDNALRFSTGMGELDRVLGGGAVKGSLVLVGGAPGIGKSTLMLQICKQLGTFAKVLYVSGEESERQLKLRAQRLGVAPDDLLILSETRLSDAVKGYSRDSLILGWGEPERTMDGNLGDTWELDEERELTVLYDEYGKVFVVRVKDS